MRCSQSAFGDRDQIVTPWPRAGRTKTTPLYDREVVGAFVDEPPQLVDVDPSSLWCTQPWVLRSHVRHYLSGVWERTGRTSADMHVRANRYPLLYTDAKDRTIILAGHHRSLAAILLGRPVRARLVGVRTGQRCRDHAERRRRPDHRPAPGRAARTPAELRVMLAADGLTDDEIGERLRFAGLDDT